MSNFHIHVDALILSKDFENHLINGLGFWRSDFSGHPEGVEHFEPPHHLTKKMATSAEFRALFNGLVSYVEKASTTRGSGWVTPMKGYLEGEFVKVDEVVEERPFNSSVKIPFTINNATLPVGGFRESEIHVVLNRDRSEQRLLQSLMDMGLYTAYMPKPYGTAQVFTVQGSKAKIQSILPALKDYLERVGGASDCSIKEERVADWWLSEPSLRLPPVIESIDWR